MNGLAGAVELLGDTPLNEPQRRFVAAASSSARSLRAVLDDILDYAKIEAGGMSVEHVDTSIMDAVDTACDTFAAQARTRGLELVAFIDPGLPQHVLSDPLRLQQILTNLVSNAVKFTEQGSVRLWVTAVPDGARFEVTDTGPGFTPEVRARLMVPFTQADASTTRRFGGTGLGLAIARELVSALGGTLEIDSVPGRGSTFAFVLPLLGSSAAAPPSSLAGHSIRFANHGPAEALALESYARAWGLRIVQDGDADISVLGSDAGVELRSSRGGRAETLRPVQGRNLHAALSGLFLGPTPASPMAWPSGPGVRALHVLVAEDNALNQLVIEALLERAGCSCQAH
jgi:two-component system sensor histidine kinase BarA